MEGVSNNDHPTPTILYKGYVILVALVLHVTAVTNTTRSSVMHVNRTPDFNDIG